MRRLAGVITTIQRPTPAVRAVAARLLQAGGTLYVAGDRKGPDAFDLPGVRFLSLEAQLSSRFALATALPTGHYARKNVAYLQAVADGSDCIYETDDDNAPLPRFGVRDVMVEARTVRQTGWVNAYLGFTKERIWPRGFPLEAIVPSHGSGLDVSETLEPVRSPIQQGLANNSPDVDAVWRLTMDWPFDFDDAPSLYLPRGTWCPFNSQSTWWWPEAYPLLYLPSNCSFRMTDIWRSFIAQRCLWELGTGVVFHAAEVFQERNPHDLMRDFRDEIPGYLRNQELVSTLEALSLTTGVARVETNLRACYEALIAQNFFPPVELELVDAWLADLATIHRATDSSHD